MIRRPLLCISLLLFAFSVPLFADNVAFTGTADFDDPATGTSMSPYSGLLNGVAVNFFCVDSSTAVSSTASWTATPTLLANSSSYASTLQFQLTGNNTAAQNNYLAMAYLVEQLQSNLNAAIQASAANNLVAEQADLNAAGEDQWAIWSFTPPNPGITNPDPYGTNAGLVSTARMAVQNGFTANFEILTPDAGQTGQEVIVPTPEPDTLLQLLAGISAVLAVILFCKSGSLAVSKPAPAAG